MDYNDNSERLFLFLFLLSLSAIPSSVNIDLKLGISDRSIFHDYHPDVEDLFSVTCDLKLVCEKLRDRNQYHKHQVCSGHEVVLFNIDFLASCLRCIVWC